MKSSLLVPLVLLSIVIVVLFTPACSDPTLVGKDLIEEDQLNINVTDTITLRTYTEAYDSILTYSPFESNQLDDYLIGKLADPIFGKTTATLYAQLLLENNNLDLSNATLDSVILVLPIDSIAVYGQQPQNYSFEVYRISEDIDNDNNFFSNQMFATGDLIGSFNGNIDPFSDIPVFNPDVDSIQQVRQLRIRMNDDFAQELFSRDSSTFRSNSTFTDYLKGIQVTAPTENVGILGFDLSTSAGMQLYYTVDTTASVFNFNFQVDGVRALNFQHDYADTPIAELLEKPELGDSLFLMQGAAGLRGIIELPHVDALRGVVINRAEIQVPIQTMDSNDDFPSPPNVILRYVEESGEEADIDDLRFSAGNTIELFGGVIIDGGENSDYYSFNISDHLQDMVDGVVSNRLIMQIFREDERATRVILKGAKNSEATKLNVTFTEL